ncbi:hypothetical protein KM043_018414 [Ampulex compressa]|nr:hypothetical protein KM043_018414 [Ampulex compressa]
MKSCYTNANSQERDIFQGYVDRCKLFYGGSVTWVYVSALSIVIGTVFLSQPFPRSAIYPFPVDQHPLKALTLLNFSLGALQSAAHIATTSFYGLLLWFTVARLEILNTEFRRATNIDKLNSCIRKHCKIIRYANEVSHVTRYAVVTMVGVATLGLIVCGVTFVSQQQSVATRGQYVLLSLTALLEIFLCAWPADHLMAMVRYETSDFCLCIWQYTRLQFLIAEMKSCYTDANSQERNIFQGYVDRCKLFYGASVTWIYVSALSIVIGTVFLSQPFPRSAVYPFPVDQHPLKALTLLNYSLGAFQSAAHVSTTCLYALLLWFTVARFEILNMEFRMAMNTDKLYTCIRKHRRMIRYANEVSRVTRYAVVTIVGVATLALIVCGVTFVSSCNVGQAAYDSQWYSQPLKFQRNILYVISKCQKPITVTVGGIMQALSLNYYAVFVSNAYSFFTTLRNTIDRKNTGET